MESAYIAGPMRGLDNFNFPAFDAVALRCRTVDGWKVYNPAEHDRDIYPDMNEWPGFGPGDTDQCPGFDLAEAMRWDLPKVAKSKHLVLLPGWEKSSGARTERLVAEQTGSVIWLAYYGYSSGWYLILDPQQKRMQPAAIEKTVIVPEPFIVDTEATGNCGVDMAAPPTHATVIGLMGYAQVGKDTLAAQLVKHHGFERIAFADALRDCLYALDPIIYFRADPIEIVRLRSVVDTLGWDRAKTTFPEVRELLQRMGTEVGREILGNDIWVQTALAKVKPGGKYVITDVRFPNELAAIDKLGGKLLRIKREGYGPVNGHWSETALDGYQADMELWNCGTPEYLADLVASAWLREVTA